MGTEAVNHPPHYTGGEIEVIEVSRHLPFNLGNAVKYVCRAGLKGDELEDLRKAEWYLKDQVKHFGNATPLPEWAVVEPSQLYHGLVSLRADCVFAICHGDAGVALYWLQREIERVERIRRPRLPAAGESGK